MGKLRYIPLFGRNFRKHNNLDFIRFFLAILVIFCHCHILYYGTEETVEPLWVFSHGQMSIGTLAVNFFFVISGFLIYQSWKNSSSVGSYLKKRFLRIYPAFIVLCLLCVFLIGPFATADFFRPTGYWHEYYERINVWRMLRNLLFLKEVEVPWCFTNLPIANVMNGSLWTIGYEFMCYLLVAILGSLKLFRFKTITLGIFLVALFVYALQEYFHIYLNNWLDLSLAGKPDYYPRFLVYFFSGILFYQHRELIPRVRSLFFLSIFICILSAYYFKGLMFTLPTFGAYVVFYIAFSLHFRMYRWARFGDFSYGIYLYAWPVQQMLLLYFEPSMNVWNLFSLATLISVFLAALSWNLVEKPALSLKTRSFLKPKLKPAPPSQEAVLQADPV